MGRIKELYIECDGNRSEVEFVLRQERQVKRSKRLHQYISHAVLALIAAWCIVGCSSVFEAMASTQSSVLKSIK